MTDKTGKRRKRPILLPARQWLPLDDLKVGAGARGEADPDRANAEKGLAGADDIVEWLALILNEQNVSIDELSRQSGIAVRTIKKWFSNNVAKRTMPNLQSIQACLEVLGYSLIPAGPSLPANHARRCYPLEQFRHSLVEKRIEQGARYQRMPVEEFIDNKEESFRIALDRKVSSRRRRTM